MDCGCMCTEKKKFQHGLGGATKKCEKKEKIKFGLFVKTSSFLLICRCQPRIF